MNLRPKKKISNSVTKSLPGFCCRKPAPVGLKSVPIKDHMKAKAAENESGGRLRQTHLNIIINRIYFMYHYAMFYANMPQQRKYPACEDFALTF